MVSPRHPQWRDSNNGNKYPFHDSATLVNKDGRAIDLDTFIDAAIYPAGGGINMYISSVDVRADQVTIYIGDAVLKNLCSCTFSPSEPAEELRIVDRFGRSAGVLVAEPVNLSVFSAWGAGVHTFLPSQTQFVISCCYPVPADMVIGFRTDDGGILFGDVYIVGEDGVALSCGTVEEWSKCDDVVVPSPVIRVSAVGDPLFRRKACAPAMFDTPRFLKEIMFQRGHQNVLVGAGEDGNVIVASAPVTTADTILRIRTSPQGVLFEAVGERLDDF